MRSAVGWCHPVGTGTPSALAVSEDVGAILPSAGARPCSDRVGEGGLEPPCPYGHTELNYRQAVAAHVPECPKTSFDRLSQNPLRWVRGRVFSSLSPGRVRTWVASLRLVRWCEARGLRVRR